MQDLFGSVRRSLVFRANPAEDDDDGGTDTNAIGGGGRFVEKINSCIRKSRAGLGLGFGFPPKQLPCPSPPPRPSPSVVATDLQSPPAIRWRKEELIGIGAFGHVYKAVNIDTGGFLAVKQVLIGANSASKEKAQAHVRELEEEVKLLKNLSHPNIVRYLGAAREEETLNILMEYVPGGSISSNLGKDGPFKEDQIRMYTKQLLLGLDYLHKNGIIHRDIKGANILVDNNGCIKLADFGASKQVAKLATMTAAKSMKGTPYWMAPEVILQTGHSFSADIWSVGCTVIEMATGKPPWSQQFQEVAALFHIGTTKSHPPIPEHLSTESKDFLLKCLQKEPKLRPTSSDLLQHPFVVSQIQQANRSTISRVNSPQNSSLHSRDCSMVASSAVDKVASGANSLGDESPEKLFNVRHLWKTSCSDDDLCHHNDKDGFLNIRSSFNPISEPVDEWRCKFNVSPNTQSKDCGPVDGVLFNGVANMSEKVDDFSFPCVPPREDDDDEVTESEIRAFLDEKAPFYEFYNTLDESNNSSSAVGNTSEEITSFNSKLPPKSKSSPSKRISGLLPSRVEPVSNSPSKASRQMPSYCGASNRALKEIPSPKFNELNELLPKSQNEQICPSFSEKWTEWEEELNEELQRNREMKRQAGVAGRVSSPIDRCTSQRSDRVGFPSPSK